MLPPLSEELAKPLYYMHLRDSTDVLLDPEGVNIATNTVPAVALHQARDCMAGEVQDGVLDLRYQIDVHDEKDAVVHSVAFADALKIVEAPDAVAAG